MALASLAALGLAIFLGFVKKMNTGLLCTALALLVGRLAGISDDEIIRGFNYSLFLMLLGVTYLFGLAEMNGTLALLSKKIVALSGRRTYLVPIVMYLFATILSALGPGTIPTAAIMMVFGMTLAKEMNINPAMLRGPSSFSERRRRDVSTGCDGHHRAESMRRIRPDRHRGTASREWRPLLDRLCRAGLLCLRRLSAAVRHRTSSGRYAFICTTADHHIDRHRGHGGPCPVLSSMWDFPASASLLSCRF